MNNLSLVLLIGENILLLIALLIYLTRKCANCQQVKCIERIFSKYCRKCAKDKPKKSTPNKEQIEIF